jgi:uncharacterized protein (DUF2141 family)
LVKDFGFVTVELQMKLLSLAVAALAATLPTLAIAGPVEVRLTGVRAGGQLLVQLCAEAEGLTRCARRARVTPTPGTMVVRFADVPSGRYAVSAFQDLDSNGRMRFNMMGVPAEPWGYSRGARGVMGPPNLADALLTISSAGAVIPVAIGL